jgi:allantoate deiminase
VLGVVLGIALVESLEERRLPFAIEVIGFSEEEGVRFGLPFIGSRALAGTLDDDALARRDAEGLTVADAIRAFGLDPNGVAGARAADDALGYLEFHIEQGPVLESRGRHVGVVSGIAGQARLALTFTGAANHAGTTPMRLRRDALAAAAEWIAAVEATAIGTPDLVATVGRIDARPNATNVIAGRCDVSLDVRHWDDDVRRQSTDTLVRLAAEIARRREISLHHEVRLDQQACAMDARLTRLLEQAVLDSGTPLERLISGAGHDAMIVGQVMPAAMLFVRSPGGISHHPAETVREEDVAVALRVGQRVLARLAEPAA